MKMKSKAITFCMVLVMAGVIMLFTGCEPNVSNDGMAGGTTPIETTQRIETTPGTTETTPRVTETTPVTGDNDINEPAVGETTPTATLFELSMLPDAKIGWGLGRDTDSRNRPIDALTAQRKYGHLCAIFIDADTENKIYLTFDEGYENGHTPLILDALRDKGVNATFFVTYDYCKSQPGLIRRMIDEGHQLANHSYSHPSFPGLSDERVREEILKLHDYVKDNFGYEMRLIRFPMGEFSERVLAVTAELGYRSVFWSFAYVDWQVDNQPPPDEAFRKITAASHPGAVILLHAVSATNAEILPGVIDYWVENGFEMALFE